MNWTVTKNNQAVNLDEVPIIDMVTLRDEILKQIKQKKRVVGFFGVKKAFSVKLFVSLADDNNAELFIASSIVYNEKSYSSITKDVPSFHMFEREFYEEFGMELVGHPWLKPLRYSKNRFDQAQTIDNYPFFKMEGEEVHEVAVGPIHAGIIESGHFRFMCNGEKVYELELQLGYQHRNIEQLFLEKNELSSHLAESIAGDTVIGHSIAHSNAIEALMNIEISNKSALIRLIALELERIAIHIGDLGAIAGDIAYLMGSSVFGATRTLVINTLLEITGSRFGRGLIRIGGVTCDIDKKMANKILNVLDKVIKDVVRMSEAMFSASTVLSRLDKTGVIDEEKAKKLGLVGMIARSSGISLDVRADHPCKFYKTLDLQKIVLTGCDAYSRTYIRYEEIKQSVKIIEEFLGMLELYENESLLAEKQNLGANKIVVSITEGWRGEIIHTVLTDEAGNISRYKIKDPSFNNWYGLALAVRNNGISDFPLCNKSFNLSYSGNDL